MVKVSFSAKREDGYLVDVVVEFENDREANRFARSLKCGIYNGNRVISIPVIERH